MNNAVGKEKWIATKKIPFYRPEKDVVKKKDCTGPLHFLVISVIFSHAPITHIALISPTVVYLLEISQATFLWSCRYRVNVFPRSMFSHASITTFLWSCQYRVNVFPRSIVVEESHFQCHCHLFVFLNISMGSSDFAIYRVFYLSKSVQRMYLKSSWFVCLSIYKYGIK